MTHLGGDNYDDARERNHALSGPRLWDTPDDNPDDEHGFTWGLTPEQLADAIERLDAEIAAKEAGR